MVATIYYAARSDAVLAGFAPFTSKDADIFVQDKELALAIAASAGWEFRNNPEPRSPVLGAIVLRRGDVALQVAVLRAVTGLTMADLNVTETITFKNGKSYSVLRKAGNQPRLSRVTASGVEARSLFHACPLRLVLAEENASRPPTIPPS